MIVIIRHAFDFKAVLGQGLSIVSLARVVSRDRNFPGIDCQRTVNCCHEIVADCRFFSGFHRHVVNSRDHIGLCAHVGDRTAFGHFYLKLMVVIIRQAFDFKAVLGQGLTIVGLARVFGCDRHFRGIDRQSSCYKLHVIISGDGVCDFRLLVISRIIPGTLTHLCDRGNYISKLLIKRPLITSKRPIKGVFAGQRLSVVSLGVSLSRDLKLQRVIDGNDVVIFLGGDGDRL